MARCKQCNGMVEKGILKCPYCGSDMSFNYIDEYKKSDEESKEGTLNKEAKKISSIEILSNDKNYKKVDNEVDTFKQSHKAFDQAAHICLNIGLVILSSLIRRKGK